MREYRELPIALIDESDNIRRSFSEERLQELAASIRQRGVLKPILVRPDGERFRVIDGWRRLSAAKLAECRTIPVRVRDIEENAAEEEMIIANLDHEDVTPLGRSMNWRRDCGSPTLRLPGGPRFGVGLALASSPVYGRHGRTRGVVTSWRPILRLILIYG